MKSEEKQIDFLIDFLLEQGYESRTGAQAAAIKIESMQPDLRAAFFQWSETGQLPDLLPIITEGVEGVSIPDLVKRLGLSIPAAFLMLDWLIRDPNNAKIALANPIDQIQTNLFLPDIKQAEQLDKPEK